MRSYSLNIADYIIRFESDRNGPELVPSAKFLAFTCNESSSDIRIKVHGNGGSYIIPPASTPVFKAPLIEEINGIRITNDDDFWTVFSYDDDLFLTAIFPLQTEISKAVLKFSLYTSDWDLWLEGTDRVDPMEYPLDGLILYYITVLKHDMMIHASGIKYSGKGYLFSGISGKGKTTIAKLWETCNATVIHDDRLIIRKTEAGYRMYNTPVYDDDEPKNSPVSSVFLIEHGADNRSKQINGALAVSSVMANCIQHNWSPEIISRLLESVSLLCNEVKVNRLSFLPEKSVAYYILEHDQ